MNNPPTTKQWQVYWPLDTDNTPVLAVWSAGAPTRLICKISPVADLTTDDLENAALIVAAPAMRQVLEQLTTMYDNGATTLDWHTAIDEAKAVLNLSDTLPTR